MEYFEQNLITFENHPLVAHKITKLRDINTGSKEFGEIITELTIMMGYEVLRDLKTKDVEIEAPLTTMSSPLLAESFTIVPILRAGLGMVDGLKTLLPTARVGYVGLYRDQATLKPVRYYYKMPVDAENDPAIIVDPALATGGSIDATIDYLKQDGYKRIKVMSIFASDVGVKLLYDRHPDVKIYTAMYIPEGLNEDGFIVTAAGDIGDRLNGTYGYKKARPAKP
ncbi:MAG: uracil phosphoribosyltransferase [Solobacterium sp.]|nr:uracil phosphoribosyltransferase [Solobacterium sp.]MBQ6221367.1 uracil phosphoribosyltransferase [Solobacterium sp.]